MFVELFNTYNWNEVKQSIYARTKVDVEYAFNKTTKRDMDDFKALISPAAMPYLEQMAQLSHNLTQKRFGKTIQMYVPLYLSNECQNICTYCGFSIDNKIKWKTLILLCHVTNLGLCFIISLWYLGISAISRCIISSLVPITRIVAFINSCN